MRARSPRADFKMRNRMDIKENRYMQQLISRQCDVSDKVIAGILRYDKFHQFPPSPLKTLGRCFPF